MTELVVFSSLADTNVHPADVLAGLGLLGLWASRAMQRSPPLMGREAWLVHASLPLTYHPVPDIA